MQDPSSLSKVPPWKGWWWALRMWAPPFGGSNPWVVNGAQVKTLELDAQHFYS